MRIFAQSSYTLIHNYKQAMDYLYRNLPMFQRQGAAAMKKDLTNIRLLLEAMGNPHKQFKSIHVGGTNGKGSASHMLSAMFQSQGYRVGVYTSPHYKDFRERMKINSVEKVQLIPKTEVVDFINQFESVIEDIRPSFFEITVAMAFKYFADQKVDLAIVEVGLGGRLDSTNVLDPIVSLITNISFDHQQFLGNTLPLIAGEKAGIIKKNTPIVIGETQNEVETVFRTKAEQMNAVLEYADQMLEASYNQETRQISVFGNGIDLMFDAKWFTPYQLKNVQSALYTFLTFVRIESLDVDWGKLRSYLENMPTVSYFLGRWMLLGESPKIIAESAHNEAGLEYLMKQLGQENYEKLHMIVGFSDDKDLNKILPKFPQKARYYYVKADIPRGMETTKLKELAIKNGLIGRSYSSVKNALRAAKRRAGSSDLIFVGGSIFVVAEVV